MVGTTSLTAGASNFRVDNQTLSELTPQSSISSILSYEDALNARKDVEGAQRNLNQDYSDFANVVPVEVGDEWAVMDTSLVKSSNLGVFYAVTSDSVEIGWAAAPSAIGYKIIVDGEHEFETTETTYDFTYPSNPKDTYHVQVIPQAPTEDDLTFDAPIYGVHITIPEHPISNSEESAANTSVEIQGPNRTRNNASIVWRSFIPYNRIDAPPVGCDYGTGYEFDGNNRGYGTMFGEWSSKTYISADYSFGNGAFDTWGHVSPSSVYDKSTGELVETRFVEDGTTDAYILGEEIDSVDIRFSLQAAIPYCIWNSIEGAFSISVSDQGNYAIFSGSHRQMPNHEVIIGGNERSTDPTEIPPFHEAVVYQRDLADPLCLVNQLCSNASMTGMSGKY